MLQTFVLAKNFILIKWWLLDVQIKKRFITQLQPSSRKELSPLQNHFCKSLPIFVEGNFSICDENLSLLQGPSLTLRHLSSHDLFLRSSPIFVEEALKSLLKDGNNNQPKIIFPKGDLTVLKALSIFFERRSHFFEGALSLC